MWKIAREVVVISLVVVGLINHHLSQNGAEWGTLSFWDVLVITSIVLVVAGIVQDRKKRRSASSLPDGKI